MRFQLNRLAMRIAATMASVSIATIASSASAAVTVPTTDDYFTTEWAFGAPYLRGRTESTARASLGVSTIDPFLRSQSTTPPRPGNPAEEVTYFTFANFASLVGNTTPASSAKLRVRMVARPNGTLPSATTPFSVSAQRVTANPVTSIDPTLANGPGSYVEFKNTKIGALEDTRVITTSASAIYEWDVTALVNEWIANGTTNAAYTVAMTGRFGNVPDTTDTGIFHAFDNTGAAAAQLPAQLVVTLVPEPATLLSLAAPAVLLVRRARKDGSGV